MVAEWVRVCVKFKKTFIKDPVQSPLGDKYIWPLFAPAIIVVLLKIRAAPSVEAHHRSVGPDTGRNWEEGE